MSEPQHPGMTNGDGTPSPQEVRVQVLGQYIKDLSFENPGAPGNAAARPQIELGVDLQARRLDQDRYEVDLKLRVTAKSEDKPLFLLELVYAGMFGIQNAPPEIVQQFLLIEAPHIIFPFARRVVADVIRDGGMPPLLIEPIDFAALYRAKQAEAQQQQSQAPATV
ncbi:MAG: protein-export chaperone SecB [Alphaproteobacteria bacterium]|jgi:preprotein translocase subunit SecB|nr:protein-export chaperone SecB [Alphaproteobacteria bacterium]